jgi:hypothetical protein
MALSTDFILLLAGFLLSLFAFSLLLGDNFLFRLASAILSGALTGFVLLLLIEKVIVPLVLNPLLEPGVSLRDQLIVIAVILSALLLFMKFYFRSGTGGNLVLVILLCTAVAVTTFGIVNGSLINLYRGLILRAVPAVENRNELSSWVSFIVILAGVFSTLIYTQHYFFGAKHQRPGKSMTWVSNLGEAFAGIALGAIFAGCFISSALILIEQISLIIGSGQELLQWVK